MNFDICPIRISMNTENAHELSTENSDHASDVPSHILKSSSETDMTYRLKWAAWRWLYSVAGCRAIGMEVKLEGPFGRVVDLVGVGKGNVVYIVEVKSSRGDLRRDDKTKGDRQRALAQFNALQDAAALTNAVLDDARGHAVDSSATDGDWRGNPTYVAARRDHNEIEDRLAVKQRALERFSTKFHDPSFLACADFHYIAAPEGLITRAELPPFWGLIDEDAKIVVPAVQKQVRRNTVHILRAIAKANTRDLMKACGVPLNRQSPTK